MRIANKTLQDPLYLTGLILLTVSFLIFILPVIYPAFISARSNGAFLINFAFVVVYFLVLWIRGRLKRGRNGLHHIILFLVLFLISAYSLNRQMVVFEQSVDWFAALVIAVSVNYLLFIFFEQMPQWVRYLVCGIAGMAMVTFFYLATYLLPLYAIGVVASPALGISLHSFVPLLFCIYTVVLLKRVNTQTGKYWLPFGAGAVLPVVFTIIYMITWNNNLRVINKTFKYATFTENDQLPSWVRVSQRMSENAITKKILKTGLVYAVPEIEGRNWLWRMPSLNFESRAHDPLVMISSLFCGPVNVPEQDRIRILESMYDSRHEGEERLWSGKDLITEQVDTRVELWPALRIAYSELNIIVGHTARNASRTNTQEAIYTFHLPEGGVVTSLSLWIEGKEEKGILTTKSKADAAYRTIVGVERRDPSVVHWQEGNTVTVRVFPVMNGQSRKFKLGVTSPLAFTNGNLRYENIYFDGPSFAAAEEAVNISFAGPTLIDSLPKGFVRQGNDLSKESGRYAPAWSVSFPAPAIAKEAFSFEDYSYSIKPIQQETESFDARSVFLDINAAWSAVECDRIYHLVKDKKVYVSTGKKRLIRLTETNKQGLFAELRKNNFSLFPFYKIRDSATSLVISKSGPLSPSIDDLRNSSFLGETNRYFSDGKKMKLFNIGDELCPFLKSLKEFRMLQYDQGDAGKLKQLLAARVFTKTPENDDEVPVYDAGIAIERTGNTGGGTAPDHLMRLFAYNHILQRSGSAILADTLNEAPLIAEAQEAYVVSPFSSLVVLETQKDYDRFDITSSKNSLQNASSQSQGAVPEPHEWALIVLVLLLAAAVKFRPGFLLIRK